MIDDPDCSKSTIRLLVFQAVKLWKSEALFHLLFDEDYIVRSAVARELQMRGEEEIFSKVIGLWEDKRSYVREICAFSLGQFGTPHMPYKEQSLPVLLNMFIDHDREVRASAICAVGHLCADGMPVHVESKLLSMADDKDEDIRESVAFALASSSGSKPVMKTLKRLKKDHNKDVRSWAKTAIVIINDGKNEQQQQRVLS